MHHAVTEVMQVDPFGGDIRTDQQTCGTGALVERINGVGQVFVAHIAAQNQHLVFFEFAVFGQVLF